jgi:hypothetical protein
MTVNLFIVEYIEGQMEVVIHEDILKTELDNEIEKLTSEGGCYAILVNGKRY